MKFKRYQKIGMSAGVFVFTTIAAASFLLGTTTGLRWISSGAQWAVEGLEIGDVSGSLLHLRLSDVRYEGPGLSLRAENFSYDIAGRDLFSNRIVVSDLRLMGADVKVVTADLPAGGTSAEEPSSSSITELRAPIPLFLQNATVADTLVSIDGTTLSWQDFSLAGRWFERQITLEHLAWTGGRIAVPAERAKDEADSIEETASGHDSAKPVEASSQSVPADGALERSGSDTEKSSVGAYVEAESATVEKPKELVTVATGAQTSDVIVALAKEPFTASSDDSSKDDPITVQNETKPLGETLKALFAKPLLSELPDVVLPVDLDLEELVVADFTGFDAHLESLRLAAKFADGALAISRFNAEGSMANVKAAATLEGNVRMTGPWKTTLGVAIDATIDTTDVTQTAKFTTKLAGAVKESLRLDAELQANLPTPLSVTLTGEASPAVAGFPLSLTLRSPGFEQDTLTVSGVDFSLTGSAVDYRLEGKTHLAVRDVAKGDLSVKGKGTEANASLSSLLLATDRGTVEFAGTLDWYDAIRWETDLKIQGLDTGTLIFPKAPIRLSGDMQTKGFVKGADWSASLTGVDLQGTIQKAPLGLKGSFGMNSDGSFFSPGLKLQLGINTLDLEGEVKVQDDIPRFNVRSNIHAPDFSRAVPGATGNAEGHFHLKGKPSFPILDVDIRASNLSFAQYSLQSLLLKGGIAQDSAMMGDVTLTAQNLSIPGVTLSSVKANLRGKERKHNLTLHWDGEPVSGDMKLTGDFLRDAAQWSGQIASAVFTTPVGDVKLARPLSLRWRNTEQALRIGTHCWTHESAQVCLKKTAELDLSGKRSMPVSIGLEKFDLAFFADKLPRTTALEGRLKGTADLVLPAGFAGIPQGRVAIESEGLSGTIRTPEDDFVLGFDAFTVTSELREKRITLDWLLNVTGNGAVSGRVLVTDPLTSKTLAGNLHMEDLSVAVVNPLLSAGEKAEGVIYGDLRFGGSLTSPTLTGETGIRGARVDSAKLPFEMLPSDLILRFGGRSSILEGKLRTPKGEVTIAGDASWETLDAWRAKVTVKSKNLRLTVPPMVEADLTTYVSFEALPEKYRLEGLLSIPWARVTVKQLPDSAVAVSDDEVRLDRPGSWQSGESTSKASVPLESALFIVLGDDVRVDGMGLKARLTGKLSVAQLQNGLGLNGQITVPFGQFRAYGQDLVVRKGEFLFSGPVSNPLLTIEAIRNPERTADDVVAGIRVTGSAQRPKAVIFSEPALSEQEAFSYLIRGEGLDPSGETDNSAITSALIGLGLSQSSGLLTEMGDAIGLSDFGIDTEGVGDSSQVVLSAYLLPGLKVKYGVGLFDSLATITLRYRLLPRLYLEAVSGVDQAIDLLYQFEF